MTEQGIQKVQARVCTPFTFTKEDKDRAKELKREIEHTAVEIAKAHDSIMHGFVRLGVRVLEVREKKYWSLLGFHSFSAYIADLRGVIKRRRTRIYNAVGVAERLLPHVSEESLEAMGISKANDLASMVRQTGRIPSDNIVNAGIRLERSEYKAELAKEFRVFDTRPNEKYRDMGGFYCSDEEWETIQHALRLSKMKLLADGLIRNDTSELTVMKLSLIQMAQECIGSWGNGDE